MLSALHDLPARLAQAADLPGRDPARELLQDELRRPPYQEAQPPLVARLLGRLLRAIGDLFDAAGERAPGGALGLVALAVLLALVVAVVLARLGPLARQGPKRDLFAGSPALTADEHRALAERAAGDGRYADAVRERLRAIVRDLEHRGALDPRPGRTAGEVARDGGAAIPSVAGDLARAASVFDEVWYGGRSATADSYATLVEVDRRVAGTRLALA